MPVISPQGLESKSCYTCTNGPTATMVEHVVLTFFSTNGQTYEVPVYAGSMYKITYYDSAIQNWRTITGMVTGVNTSTIAVEVMTVMDSAGNICLCSHRDTLAGFISAEYFYVPITNISSIVAVDPSKTDDQQPTPTPTERCETFVSVLGISSTVIRAVIVRLKIFDDDVQHTVTPVDMVVGNSYHVTFAKDNSVYELEGRLVRIEELGLFGNETAECGYVRQDNSNTEVVGANGNTYDPNYFYSLPKYNPDGVRIRFVFDTSRDFVTRYDTVMLGDIRNVHPIGSVRPPCPPPPCPPGPPMPPYPPVPPTPSYPPYPPCPPTPPCPGHPPIPFPPGPCDPVPPIGPCDPVPPIGPGDVPPTPPDPGIDTNNWSYTTNTTSGTTTPPMTTNYTQLNSPEDYLGDFNKP